MKYHYIYFILLPLMLVVAMMLPFQIYEYDDMEREVRNGFHDDVTGYIFLLPTLLATILLLIRNYVTAILGACIYFGVLLLAGFMNYVMHFQILMDDIGIGPFCVLMVALSAVIISLVHAVKLVKNRKFKLKSNSDLLDEMDF